MHGSGTFTLKDRREYKGEWKDGTGYEYHILLFEYFSMDFFLYWNEIFVSRTIFSFSFIFSSIFQNKGSRAVHFIIFQISLVYSLSHPSVQFLIPFPKPLSHNSILNLGSITNFYLIWISFLLLLLLYNFCIFFKEVGTILSC